MLCEAKNTHDSTKKNQYFFNASKTEIANRKNKQMEIYSECRNTAIETRSTLANIKRERYKKNNENDGKNIEYSFTYDTTFIFLLIHRMHF